MRSYMNTEDLTPFLAKPLFHSSSMLDEEGPGEE
jgi:hypothetical protein